MEITAKIGIVSMGEMGTGVARLLIAQGFKVFTNIEGRSDDTRRRVEGTQTVLLSSDIELVRECDYILSIVPPKDSLATALRIVEVAKQVLKKHPLVFLDLNAIAPSSARKLDEIIASSPAGVHFIDGGIIGGPPRFRGGEEDHETDLPTWSRPSIVLSGPLLLECCPENGAELAHVLNSKHVGPDIGAASGLKCCFASLSKGFTALAIQSFTSAQSLGVLPELESYLELYNPSALERTSRGIPGMVTKAGRWVEEMKEIGKTFSEEGGWQGASAGAGQDPMPGVFDGIANVFDVVSANPILKDETLENRRRGRTAEDVVTVLNASYKLTRNTAHDRKSKILPESLGS